MEKDTVYCLMSPKLRQFMTALWGIMVPKRRSVKKKNTVEFYVTEICLMFKSEQRAF